MARDFEIDGGNPKTDAAGLPRRWASPPAILLRCNAQMTAINLRIDRLGGPAIIRTRKDLTAMWMTTEVEVIHTLWGKEKDSEGVRRVFRRRRRKSLVESRIISARLAWIG